LHAFSSEHFRNLAPDAGTGTRDDRDPAVDLEIHDSSSLRFYL
jgi:hypothetical protein